MHQIYHWEYSMELAPYDKLIDVLEAFYVSYPQGDYECLKREKYKLTFRRGRWRRAWMGFGDWIPDELVKGHFEQWPVIVRVLVRPAPSQFLITCRYECHVPKSVSQLTDEVQASVDEHICRELKDLSQYLADCANLSEPPAIQAV
jgi:hypothetical protein